MKSNPVTYLKSSCLSTIVGVLFLVFMVNKTNAQDGKTLFKQNCGVCHTTTQQKLVGPGLEGITTKRKEDWLIKWIKDSQALVQSGDAEAKQVFEDGGKMVMPPFASLSDEDVKAILSFIGNPEPAAAATTAPAGETKTVVKEAPLSTGVKLFIWAIIFVVGALVLYIYMMKRKLRSMGYAFDNVPFKDRVSKFADQNGRFLLVIAIIVILTVMKSCVSHIM